MDLNLILPSNASGDIFPGNTLTAYRVLLQKYTNLAVPNAGTLLSLTMPTWWSNIKRSEIYLVQVEKAAARPTYVRVHNRGGVSGGDADDDDDDKRSGRSASGLRRGAKISKLRRLIETAARRRAGGERGHTTSSESPRSHCHHKEISQENRWHQCTGRYLEGRGRDRGGGGGGQGRSRFDRRRRRRQRRRR